MRLLFVILMLAVAVTATGCNQGQPATTPQAIPTEVGAPLPPAPTQPATGETGGTPVTGEEGYPAPATVLPSPTTEGYPGAAPPPPTTTPRPEGYNQPAP